MAKAQSTFPTSIDSTLQTDRNPGDVITSESYDIIEDAIYELERKVGIDNSSDTSSLDYIVKVAPTAVGSSGYVQFNASGKLAGDAGLFWDNVNKRLGLGATSNPNCRLDSRGSYAKSSTQSLEYISQVASTDSTSPLLLRLGIKTDATASNRYGAIEVDDGGTKRTLALQPAGGKVGIGTSSPLVDLDFRVDMLKGASGPLSYVAQIGTKDSAPLALRFGFRPHSSESGRYATIEVDDNGSKRSLFLQPDGGNLYIGGYMSYNDVSRSLFCLNNSGQNRVVIDFNNSPRIDIKGNNVKSTTSALDYLNVISSSDTSDYLALRFGIKTDSTATSRYGAIEVDDGGTKRALHLQPGGGDLRIGSNANVVWDETYKRLLTDFSPTSYSQFDSDKYAGPLRVSTSPVLGTVPSGYYVSLGIRVTSNPIVQETDVGKFEGANIHCLVLYNNANAKATWWGVDSTLVKTSACSSTPNNFGCFNAVLASEVTPTTLQHGVAFRALSTDTTGVTGVRQGAAFLAEGNRGWLYPFIAYDTDGSSILFLVNQYGHTYINGNLQIAGGDPGSGISGRVTLSTAVVAYNDGTGSTAPRSVTGSNNPTFSGYLKIYYGEIPVYIPFYTTIQ